MNYRFVYNKTTGATTVAPAVRGTQATLNRRAGEFLESLQVARPDVGSLPPGTRAFVDQAIAANWLTQDLRLNGTFRTSTERVQLSRLQIELSLRCNLTCTYCYSESGPQQDAHLADADVCRILDEAELGGVTTVDFTGGEFFLFKGWRNVLRRARRLGLVVTVHTNGLLLTDRHVAELVEQGVRYVQVSADSSNADQHDSIRGVSGAHRRMVNGIRRAKDAGLQVRVVLMAHQKNKDTLLESIRWFRSELGVDVGVDRVIAAGGALHDPVAVGAKEFYELIAPALGDRTLHAQACGTELREGANAPECGVAHSFVYITADGHYSLCPTMTHREEERFRGPRVSEMGLMEAWRAGQVFNEFRFLNCENATSSACPAASTCGGGCRSNAYSETGVLDSPDVVSCNLHKNAGKVFIDFREVYARDRAAR